MRACRATRSGSAVPSSSITSRPPTTSAASNARRFAVTQSAGRRASASVVRRIPSGCPSASSQSAPASSAMRRAVPTWASAPASSTSVRRRARVARMPEASTSRTAWTVPSVQLLVRTTTLRGARAETPSCAAREASRRGRRSASFRAGMQTTQGRGRMVGVRGHVRSPVAPSCAAEVGGGASSRRAPGSGAEMRHGARICAAQPRPPATRRAGRARSAQRAITASYASR